MLLTVLRLKNLIKWLFNFRMLNNNLFYTQLAFLLFTFRQILLQLNFNNFLWPFFFFCIFFSSFFLLFFSGPFFLELFFMFLIIVICRLYILKKIIKNIWLVLCMSILWLALSNLAVIFYSHSILNFHRLSFLHQNFLH